MAWQYEIGSGTDRAVDYRDFVVNLVAFMTSQHVATVAVNAGGTGYIVNEIVEVDDGTSREKAKAKVTSVSSGVVTGVSLFETGGAYSSDPTLTGSATTSIGPTAGAGTGLTLNLTMTGLIGTTGLSVTGGTGSGATVDITLAQTGWAISTTNTNNRTHNSLTDEKVVVLVGDASGFTNKPYIGLRTGTETVGVNTRYFVGLYGFAAYNSSLGFTAQPGVSPNLDGSDNPGDGGAFLIFPQNISNDTDFVFSCDDLRVQGVINVNPTATTDDGRYEFFYLGFGDRVKTETEDPYPLVVFGSSRDRDADPTVTNGNITSPAEARAPSSGPFWYYRTEDSVWTQVKNNDTGAIGEEPDVCWPFGDILKSDNNTQPSTIVADNVVEFNDQVFKRDRSSPTRILRMVPGTAQQHTLWPLIVLRKPSITPSTVTDSVRFSMRGMYCVFNSDSTGAAINDFSEDIITANSKRHWVFHNFTLTERYQYIALEEDV